MSNSNESVPQCIEIDGISESTVVGLNYVIMRTLMILCIVSSCFQVVVILLAFKHVRRHTSECCLHILLLNMTIADLLLTGLPLHSIQSGIGRMLVEGFDQIGYDITMGLCMRLCYMGIALPMEFLIDAFEMSFPYNVNLMMHFLIWLGTSVSGLSLVLLNVDKLLYFKFPLRYSKILTQGRANALAACTWLLSAMFINLAFYTGALECRYNCERLTTDESQYGLMMYLLFTFFVSAFPALSSLIVALYLLRIVQTHRKNIAEEQNLCPSGGARKNTALLSRMRTFYFIFISTIFTVCTLVPYRLVTIYRTIVQAQTEVRSCLAVFISVLTYYNMDLNPIFNPFLTVTVLPQYRFPCMNLILPSKLRRGSDEPSYKCNTEL